MKILVIHEVNYIAKPLFEIHDFPEYLASKGWDVSFYQFPEGESPQSVSALAEKPRTVRRTAFDGEIKLLTPRSLSGDLLGRLMESFISIWRIPKLIRDVAPDLILLYAVPTYGWQVVLGAARYGVPVVYRALDVASQIRRTPFSFLVRVAERFVIRHANHVSANNSAMLEHCLSSGAREKRSSVEYPPVGLNLNSTPQDLAEALVSDLGSAKCITYMGSFFYFSGLRQVITEFAKNPTPNVLLLLIGGGEQDRELRTLVKELKVEGRVIFTGFVPRDALHLYLQASTVLINPMEVRGLSRVALPQKVIQYLATSNPVVSTRLDGLEDAVGDFSNLYFEDSPEAVLQKALELCRADDGSPVASNLEKLEARFGAGALEKFESMLKRAAELGS